jgi:hypothetical protein
VGLDLLKQFTLLRDDPLEGLLEIGLGGGIAAGGIEGDGSVELCRGFGQYVFREFSCNDLLCLPWKLAAREWQTVRTKP